MSVSEDDVNPESLSISSLLSLLNRSITLQALVEIKRGSHHFCYFLFLFFLWGTRGRGAAASLTSTEVFFNTMVS